MIRRIVLWAWADGVTAEQKLRAKEGLAYIRYASGVDGMDFGEDLAIGEPTNYNLAMERDHLERASWDAYNEDPHHDRVGAYLDSITIMDRTARVDLEYQGPSAVRGAVRHVAMYVWASGVSEADRQVLQAEARALPEAIPSVRAAIVGNDLGWRQGHVDWVMEAQFDDRAAFLAFMHHPSARRLAARLAGATVPARGAQIQHLILSG